MKERLRRRGREPQEWRQQSTGINASTVYLTPAEAIELRRHVRELTDRHGDRWTNPDLRPAAARQVRVFLSMTVAPRHPRK